MQEKVAGTAASLRGALISSEVERVLAFYIAGTAIISSVIVRLSKPVPGTIAFEAAGDRPSSKYSGRSSLGRRLVPSSLT
jgi:hypothetical protein